VRPKPRFFDFRRAIPTLPAIQPLAKPVFEGLGPPGGTLIEQEWCWPA